MSYSEGELVQPWRSRAPQREWEFNESEYELIPFAQGELEGEQQQPQAQLLNIPAAVAANRISARRIGFACVFGGRMITAAGVAGRFNLPLPGLSASPTEEDVARAVAAWQTAHGLPGNGRLDLPTWRRMQNDPALGIRRPTYAPFSMTVSHGGRTLGVIEKTAPYRDCYRVGSGSCQRSWSAAATRGGSEIQLGFRVTDMAAVRAAGFVDAAGEPQFRWVQIVQFRAPGSGNAALRRFRQIIDPTSLVAMPNDRHPYYWYETLPAGLHPGFHIRNYIRQRDRDPSGNGLCYDLMFYDAPAFPLASATPQRRALFNFETALIGVRGNILAATQKRNVVLNTFTWGQDLVVNGPRVEVRMNVLAPGTTGGSATFRSVVSREMNNPINAGGYPNHCFVGSFTGGARCP